MPDREKYPKCFGPYLRYALSTELGYFKFVDENKEFSLCLLIEFKTSGRRHEFSMKLADDFVDRINDFLHGIDISESAYLTPTKDDAPYGTLITPIEAVTATSDRQGSSAVPWDTYVSRVELSMPLKKSEQLRGAKPPLRERKKLPAAKKKSAAKKLLIGILDDGCPFAAAQFLKTSASGDPTTRVRAIWDQNAGKTPIPVGTRQFGQPLANSFGLEFQRQSSSGQIGLDEWIKLHTTTSGAIDEDNCYADAGFTRLARAQSHGAHVMDLLTGSMPLSSRLGPVGTGSGDRRDPPSWTPAPASDAEVDIVFVQYSDNCIKDATGLWLPAYVPAGIRYIMSFADPTVIDRVIINLSWGPTTGPHDGTALLESALNGLVAQYNGTPGYPQLDIFLAAGNSFLSEEHVTFTADTQNPDVEWTWRLPPDNSVRCFAEIWMDAGQAPQVTLTSPSGVSVPAYGPYYGGCMYLLVVDRTVAATGIIAEHGDYTIRISGLGAGAEIHAYAARTDPNMGVITGAKRSYFVDAGWEKTRSASASCTFQDGEFDKTGSLISRLGTLNGIATANNSSVHVAGGFTVLDGRKSPYASAGPARGASANRRLGPDYVLPCDESNALGGVLAGGTRSGVVFRMIGTSTAAPQFGRLFAKGPLPMPIPYPLPNQPERRGGGDLGPP